MHNLFYDMFIRILYMFRATLCSSSGGQLYEYNCWYNYSVLVAVRYAGQDGTSSTLTCIPNIQFVQDWTSSTLTSIPKGQFVQYGTSSTLTCIPNGQIFQDGTSSLLTCIPDGHQNTVIIPEVVLIQLSSWGWAHSCSKHVEDSNKHIIEEIVRQVGYLSERKQ